MKILIAEDDDTQSEALVKLINVKLGEMSFDVEVIDVREATAEELSHGHVHGEDGHHH